MVKIVLGKLKRGIKKPKLFLNFFLKRMGINYQLPVLKEIILYVNTICNAKCLFCDIGQANIERAQNIKREKRGIALLAKSQDNFLSLELLNKILEDDYVKKSRPAFNLLMAEPLLSENIFDIVSSIKKRKGSVNITTNGILLSEKARGLVSAGLDTIQISISGPEKIHNKIAGGNFFEKAIKGIKILNKISDIPVTINYTVSNLNYNCIKEFIEEICSKNLKIHCLKIQYMDFVSRQIEERQNNNFKIKQTISSISEIVDPDKVNPHLLSKQIKIIKNKKWKNIDRIEIIPDIDSEIEMGKYFNKIGLPLKTYNKCYWPFTQIAVKTDGDTLFHMRCFNYKIGNVKNENIKEIFFSKSAKYFRKKFIKSNLCFPACTRCCGVMHK